MAGHASTGHGETPRDVVRFYLLDHQTVVGKAIDIALLVLNVVFVVVFVLETYPFSEAMQTMFWYVEVAISLIFLAEYVLRLYGARNRLKELFNPYSIVDLLAILPTLVVFVSPAAVITANIGFLRAIRVIRFLRFYRFTQDEEFFFGTVSVGTLRVMKLLLTVVTIFFVAAGMFYSFEFRVNPTVDNFGDAFYFVVVALTTVGFGDIVPVTQGGRWVTVAAILAGIILIPWQASKIVKEWAYRDKVNVVCPNCGLAHHDRDASHCKSCGHVIYQEYDSRE
ncbi:MULTISPECIES: ion transporter [Haloferax]|uniref:Ion transporter n=2 Tax=Haloferax TaxID=2251 RepID=A0A6G1Z1W1_9EURY|nr:MULTISPECIES: ion transporter [Haloferax]KAB1187625.1 ion transporter [Haloferax sp. CBA1149]MRW80284.1 ion transporter [Haloferax marinisediminis]